MAETPLASYTILRQVATPDEKFPTAWVVIGTAKARSQGDAIKALADKNVAAIYGAVPERSWMPVRVAPSTVTTFALEELPPVAATPAESGAA